MATAAYLPTAATPPGCGGGAGRALATAPVADEHHSAGLFVGDHDRAVCDQHRRVRPAGTRLAIEVTLPFARFSWGEPFDCSSGADAGQSGSGQGQMSGRWCGLAAVFACTSR